MLSGVAAGRRGIRVLDPSSFASEPLRRVAAYWLAKARPDRLPGRADIHPEELVRELPFIYLVDVVRTPLTFRYRLVGTAIVQWAGREYTGVAINEAEYGPHWEAIFNDYRAVMESGAPTRAERSGPWLSKEHQYYERFLAPLASDGRTVDMILGALHIIERPR